MWRKERRTLDNLTLDNLSLHQVYTGRWNFESYPWIWRNCQLTFEIHVANLSKISPPLWTQAIQYAHKHSRCCTEQANQFTLAPRAPTTYLLSNSMCQHGPPKLAAANETSERVDFACNKQRPKEPSEIKSEIKSMPGTTVLLISRIGDYKWRVAYPENQCAFKTCHFGMISTRKQINNFCRLE